MSAILTYFGIGQGADIETINTGKRRTVTLLGFLVFALIVPAAVSPYWIVGGLETSPSRRRGLSEVSPLAAAKAEALAEFLGFDVSADITHGRSLQTSATRKVDFYLGLQTFTSDFSGPPGPSRPNGPYCYYWPASANATARPTIHTQTTWQLSEYVPYFNTLASLPNTFLSGNNPLKLAVFVDTYGLLVTSAFFAICAWLGMVLVNHGVPQIVSYKWTFPIIGGLSAASSFFAMVAVALFGSSKMKDEFCSIFDPDANYNSMPCGYSDGFNAAIAGLFFALLQSVLFFFWMPHASGGAKYEFSEVGKGFDGATEAKTTFTAGSTSSVSGYQDI